MGEIENANENIEVAGNFGILSSTVFTILRIGSGKTWEKPLKVSSQMYLIDL